MASPNVRCAKTFIVQHTHGLRFDPSMWLYLPYVLVAQSVRKMVIWGESCSSDCRYQNPLGVHRASSD